MEGVSISMKYFPDARIRRRGTEVVENVTNL